MFRLVKTEDLPQDVSTSEHLKNSAKYFVPILYFGREYYLPLTKEIKKVLGISICTINGKPTVIRCDELKIEEGLRDIIAAVYLQIRDTVADEVFSSLSKEITEGFKKLFEQNLATAIHTRLDGKLLFDDTKKDTQPKSSDT